MGIKEDTDKFIELAGDKKANAGDEVDQVIQETIDALAGAGYEEEKAESMVFEALAALIENEVIPDTPDPHLSYQIKEAWIQSFNHHISIKLEEMGVAFE